MYLHRSSAHAKPPSVTSHFSWPFGGSPRSATMLQMPADFAPSRPKSHVSFTWFVHVRCMLTITLWRDCDSFERSSVSSDVVPPAPHVKSMKRGSCFAIVSITLCSFSTPSGVFGGKYSNEMKGCSVFDCHSPIMSMILPFLTVGVAPRESGTMAILLFFIVRRSSSPFGFYASEMCCRARCVRRGLLDGAQFGATRDFLH